MLDQITPGHLFAAATSICFLLGLGLGFILGCMAKDPQQPETTIQARATEDPMVSAWAAKVRERYNQPTITVKNPDPYLVSAYGIQEPPELVRVTELTAYRSDSPCREDLIAYCTRPRIAPRPKR